MVDRQDRGCVLVEDHSVVANAEAIAAATLKGLHVTLARHGVPVKLRFHLLASVLSLGRDDLMSEKLSFEIA
jgi:hypothetical protein